MSSDLVIGLIVGYAIARLWAATRWLAGSTIHIDVQEDR